MNMDGFSKMLENCSNDELEQLTTLIANQTFRNINKAKEKIETLIKDWEDYKNLAPLTHFKEVVIQINIHDKNDYETVTHKIKYSTIKNICHSDEHPALIQIELNPIEL